MALINNKNLTGILLLLLLFGVHNSHGQESGNQQASHATRETQGHAIRSSVLEKSETTVGAKVAMVGPGKGKLNRKVGVMDFYKTLCALRSCGWEANIFTSKISNSLRYVFIRYRFTQDDALGHILYQHNEYLELIIKELSDSWKLVHDQYSIIPELPFGRGWLDVYSRQSFNEHFASDYSL